MYRILNYILKIIDKIVSYTHDHVYIILLLLFLFIFYFYLSLSYSKYKRKNCKFNFEKQVFEYYTSQNESSSCKGTPFCAYDVKEDKCKCASQKDDARLQFPNDPSCCDTLCSALPKEKCVSNNELPNLKYYCNVSGKCQEYNATMKDSVIMANVCGVDGTTNRYIMPFTSKEECIRLSDPCNKYNDDKLSAAIQENSCLDDKNCGWCVNESGNGKCVSGSPAGPNDLDTYYFCTPSEAKSTGSDKGIFKYGKIFTGV